MKTLQTYFQCWLEIAKQVRYQDKWLSDETIFRAIKAQFPSLEALGINRGIMNKAISSYEGSVLDDFTAVKLHRGKRNEITRLHGCH
jgi:hypothetical protein